MNAITTPIPENPDRSGLEFMMELIEVEISIYTEEKDFKVAADMCQHYLNYFQAWEKAG